MRFRPKKSSLRSKQKGQNFWDKEYKSGNNLTLSDNPSEDLIKFTRFLKRLENPKQGLQYLDIRTSVADLGCGNGRNLIYLSETFNIHGIGYDISKEAIAQAVSKSENLPLSYETRSIVGTFDIENDSQDIVLDMMASHFLKNNEREVFIKEIVRILKPGGWLFFKTFLRDEDEHAERLLKESPAEEAGSYIHPHIGVAEHVFTEQEIKDYLSPAFTIHKMHKSHGHLRHGKAHKRRSISIYAEKNF